VRCDQKKIRSGMIKTTCSGMMTRAAVFFCADILMKEQELQNEKRNTLCCLSYIADRQKRNRIRIKIRGESKKRGDRLEQKPIRVTCVYAGEEDAKSLLFSCFRLYLCRILALPDAKTVS